MAIDPDQSGVRNITSSGGQLYATVDSADNPLYVAAQTSGIFADKEAAKAVAEAGGSGPDSWGSVIATPTVGENTVDITGAAAEQQIFYGYVQEDAAPPPSYDFTPTATIPYNAKNANAADMTASATLGPSGLQCWDVTNSGIPSSSHVNWIARNNYLGRLTPDGVTYGNKQTFLFKIDPTKTEANLYASVCVAQMGMGYSYSSTLHSINLTTGELTVGNEFVSGDNVRFTGGVYEGGEPGWVWITVEFTIANGHAFTNPDQIGILLCSTPGERVIDLAGIGDSGYHMSDAENV